MDQSADSSPRGRVAYFFSRFPHLTETFLQREVAALHALGVRPRLYSWHGGGAEFDGSPIIRFSKWRLLELLWRLPVETLRRPRVVGGFLRRLATSRPRGWLNFWENLYGAGIGVVLAGAFREQRVAHIHAVWSSLPAMAAWVLSELADVSFSTGAHAYDLFEHGGDWLLRGKCAAASFVHTSTLAGRQRLEELGVDPAKVLCVRRGLERFPECRPLRPERSPLQLVCVARLVEKKGLVRQLELYRAMHDAGLQFTARIVGEGPQRAQLEARIAGLGLASHVALGGAVPSEQVWLELRKADVLVHTGVVAASGDRDGLPNVVPEAMAAGVIVVTAPAPGVQEAITHETTGLVCDLSDEFAWLRALQRIQNDEKFADGLRVSARHWVEQNFDAVANARVILRRMCEVAPALRNAQHI